MCVCVCVCVDDQLLWAIDCVLYFISYKLEKRSILVATEEDFPTSPQSDLSEEDTDSFQIRISNKSEVKILKL